MTFDDEDFEDEDLYDHWFDDEDDPDDDYESLFEPWMGDLDPTEYYYTEDHDDLEDDEW